MREARSVENGRGSLPRSRWNLGAARASPGNPGARAPGPHVLERSRHDCRPQDESGWAATGERAPLNESRGRDHFPQGVLDAMATHR